jgi:predicted component of type VI protein secretion system
MAGMLVMAMTACSSDQPKPMAQPTPDQVRGHADRAFDKLKQEEQERPAQPPAPGY